MRCSTWCLQHFSGRQRLYVGLRDAAMLLFSTASAVRGGSSRILRWSDMFVSHIPMDDVHLGKRVTVSRESEIATAAVADAGVPPPPPPTGPCGSRRQREA